MSQNLFTKLILHEGFCCPWAYCKATKNHSTKTLSDYLGLETRTIRKWKNRFKNNTISCLGCHNCRLSRD